MAYFFAHLSATDKHHDIVESLKLDLPADPTIANISKQIADFLQSERDDGNKEYILH